MLGTDLGLYKILSAGKERIIVKMLKIKNIFGKKRQHPQQPLTDGLEKSVEMVEQDSGSSSTLTAEESVGKELPLIECPVEQLSLKDVRFGEEEVEVEEESVGTVSSGHSMLEEELPDEFFEEQAELQDYMLINKIGEGAFSRVFRGIPKKSSSKAYLTRNYSEFAIKVISKERSTSKKDEHTKKSTREQVLKEVQIHKLITSGNGSEHLVQFVDFQESKNYYYIVQELLRGGEIFGEIVKYTYLSEDLSKHVIKQLALAVKHMHVMGVVHRDIKPENLLFEPIKHIPSRHPVLRKSDDPSTKLDEGEFRPNIGGGGIGLVKLADFGLSKQIYQTNTKTPCGTVGYTAPEVVKDEKYSMQVDMWGIGCVLYTILCGFPPFYDEKIDILTEKISRGEYTFLRPWWDEISDGAKNCVRKLLEVDPEKRYKIDDLLNDEWLNNYDTVKKQEIVKKKRVATSLDERRKSKSHASRKSRLLYLKRDSSLLYSPAANVMRDAFDVSNAVQRQEGDRRHQQRREMQSQICGLGSLTEGAELCCSKQQPKELDQDMFQLRLNSSTIIKRRKENHVRNGKIMIPTILD